MAAMSVVPRADLCVMSPAARNSSDLNTRMHRRSARWRPRARRAPIASSMKPIWLIEE
jgi:hypothetical protein